MGLQKQSEAVQPLTIPAWNEGALDSSCSAVDVLPLELRLVERERRRVAKELHDDVLPLLARLSRFVQSTYAPTAAAILPILHKTLADFRDLLGELHPVDLEELGLFSAVQNLCNRYSRRSGLCILFVPLGGDDKLDEYAALCLYRAIQIVLRKFVLSQNDILVLRCDFSVSPTISARCIDKRVASADWLSSPDSSTGHFETWLQALNADVVLPSRVARSGVGRGRKRQSKNHDVAHLLQLDHHSSEFPSDLLVCLPEAVSMPAPPRMSCGAADSRSKTNEQEIIALERKRVSLDISDLVVSNFKLLDSVLSNLEVDEFSASVAKQLQGIDFRLRDLVTGTYPDVVWQRPLLECLRRLTVSFAETSGLNVSYEVVDPPLELDFPFLSKLALYRIVQELLNNVEKHSAATEVIVQSSYEEGVFRLMVEDNGSGFAGVAGQDCRGLRIIRDRASELRASVSFCEADRFCSGTAVVVSIPIAEITN